MTTRAHVTVQFPIYGVSATVELREGDSVIDVVMRAAELPECDAAGVPQADRYPAWQAFAPAGDGRRLVQGVAEQVLYEGELLVAAEVISGG